MRSISIVMACYTNHKTHQIGPGINTISGPKQDVIVRFKSHLTRYKVYNIRNDIGEEGEEEGSNHAIPYKCTKETAVYCAEPVRGERVGGLHIHRFAR